MKHKGSVDSPSNVNIKKPQEQALIAYFRSLKAVKIIQNLTSEEYIFDRALWSRANIPYLGKIQHSKYEKILYYI